ncbi:MAG: hypothetical protein ACRC1Z_16325 [Waterburya sp.]
MLLVEDNAGWHRSKKAIIPEGIEIEFLPPYSPQRACPHVLQPAERLWQLVDQPLVNQYFETINQIEDILVERCCLVSHMKDEVCKLNNYHWLKNIRCLHTF